MRSFLLRAAAIALLVLVVDEAVKSAARLQLAPCASASVSACERLQVLGPLSLVRTANAGSAYGFVQGWWGWIALAALGVLLIPLYARLVGPSSRLALLAVGLQLGGGLGNLLDRLVLGGASDILYLGSGPTWNLADIAIAVGTVLATWALARRRVFEAPEAQGAHQTRPA